MKTIIYIRCVIIFSLLSSLIYFCWLGINSRNNNIPPSKGFEQNFRWKNPNSLCNDDSSKIGFHQKIVSFSLFTKNDGLDEDNFLKRYMSGIKKVHGQIKIFYPGWLMRIYTNNISMFDTFGYKSYIKENEKNLFICDITAIKSNFGNLSKIYGMIWRFLPMFDPTVDIFISRDIDSSMSERELSAVKQWEESNSVFHAMRDHPLHNWNNQPILGGLWGGKNYMMNYDMISTLRNGILTKNYNLITYGLDQTILKFYLYYPFKKYIMEHDSYLCEQYPESIPFPEQRPNRDLYVSKYFNSKVTNDLPECPIPCRPKYGKHWKYC